MVALAMVSHVSQLINLVNEVNQMVNMGYIPASAEVNGNARLY
jgi:hypothetical protein